MQKLKIIGCILFILMGLCSSAYSQGIQIDNGISWLNSSQNLTGSWGNTSTSTTTEYFSTSAVLQTLMVLGQDNTLQYQNGIQCEGSEAVNHTAYLASKISSLSATGIDLSADISLLLSYKNADGGWGGYVNYRSTNFHTSLALQALKSVNYTDTNVISSALGYLISTQNPDGGWGFYQGDDSNVYITAIVSTTLSLFKTAYDLNASITNSVTYLLTKQNPNGGFGTTGLGGMNPAPTTSTTYETALAVIALINDNTGQVLNQPLQIPIQNAIAYLTSAQLANGSWNDDPYSTALALRALATVKPNLSVTSTDISFTPPYSTAGNTVEITAIVQNTGPAEAPSTGLGQGITIQFFDGDPAVGGILIGETTIASIPAYGSVPASITWTIPSAAARSIFVTVDPLNTIDELDETDNVASRNLTSATLPDLSITSADITFSSTMPMTGDAVPITASIRNLGQTAASNATLDIYDGDPASGGIALISHVIPSIAGGGSYTLNFTTSFTAGSHTIYIMADRLNVISEGSEANNMALKTLSVQELPVADLSVSNTDITHMPIYPKEDDTVTISAVIHNIGDAPADSVLVRFYLGDPIAGGAQIGGDSIISSLAAREMASVTTTWATTGHAGDNTIFVSIDPSNILTEATKLNNKAAHTIKVAAKTGADLVIATPDLNIAPLNPTEGNTITITANVRNIGTGDAANVLVEFSLGDPNVGGTLIIGSQTIPFIAKSGSATAQISWGTAGFAGTYEIYANADPVNAVPELNEQNNMTYMALVVVEPQGPDLTITSLDTTHMATDTQTLLLSGTIDVTIQNKGNQPITTPLELTAFEDTNGNRTLDPSTDNILGTFNYTNNLAAGAADTVLIPTSGNVLFRDNLIYVMVDSGNAILEMVETNNMRNTGQQCEYRPPVGQFNPVEKWKWTGSTTLPLYNQVIQAPVVATIVDTNGDGVIDDKDVPAIIFISYSSNYLGDGVLRAVRGDNGQEIFTVTNPAYRLNPSAALAVGDIDNDGFVEIVGVKVGGGTVVFAHDGTVKWSSPYGGNVYTGGISIADIDHDGKPEIVIGGTVLNNDGTLRWETGTVPRIKDFWGQWAVIADINLDGRPKIIVGNTAFNNDGSLLWRANTAYSYGHAAVANFDNDLYPEIVVINWGYIYLLDHTGTIKWGPIKIPGGGIPGLAVGGPPVIADFDGDGKPEIGVAGSTMYTVLKADGTVLWSSVTQDLSSSSTGSSVFDFDGDGKAEVVYNDEKYLRIYRGSDGKVLFQTPNSNGTMFEYPVIVDVDNDGHAEIVVSANTTLGYGPDHGIRVFEDANNSWVNTRKIWNQHTYHITNVHDDGTIPRYEQNSWDQYNTYRCNSLLPEQALGTADITASYITIDQTNYPTSVRVSARIGNGGAVSQIAGTDIALYDGDPNLGGVLLGTTKTIKVLDAGDYEDVSITWDNPSSGNHTVFVIADNTSKFNECRENNNIASVSLTIGISQPSIQYKPDMEISPADITIIPPVIEGQSSVITAIVHNIGNLGASDVVVSFYDGDMNYGGTLIGSVTKSYIDAGATALAEVSWNTMGQSGRNYVHVVVDPQSLITESNENNNAALLPVDVMPPSKPDLAITGSDIAFSNLNPQEGQPLVILATVHNFGTGAAGITVNLYDGNPSASGVLLSSYTIAQIIPFGGQTQVIFTLDTVGLSGNHEFHLLLDPENAINETNETNNTAWNALTIGPSGLGLSITTDKAVYTANEDISITLNVTNQRDAGRTGTIEVKILDTAGNVVSNATTSQAVTLGPLETQTLSFTLNTGSILAGEYRVFSQFIEAGNAVSKIDTPITLSAGIEISSTVTTDRISYYPNQPVTLTSTVTSLSQNYIFENLTAKIAVSDQQSAVSLHTETQTIPILLPGQITELKTYWNTATYPAGAYPVTLEVRDAAGVLVSSSTATLTISDEIKPSKLLRGEITVDKQSILQGEPVNFSYQIVNIGNMDISQVDLSIRTVHVVNLSVYDTLTDQTAVLKGAAYANVQQLATGSYSAKDYLVILAASISGVEETLASTYFRVEGAPSVPSLNAPAHGSDVETVTPILSVNNATDPNDDRLTYEFQVYADQGLTTLVAESLLTEEGASITSWHPSTGSGQSSLILQENSWYYWRARAYDSRLYSEWMVPAAFRVNVTNEPPTAPTLSAPAEGSYVDTLTPVLTVNNASDPDSSNLTYNFVIALDPDFVNIVDQQIGIFSGQGSTSWQPSAGSGQGPLILQENTWYYWKAQADDWLITGPWMTTAQFFVNTANEAPTAPVIIDPVDNGETASRDVVITVSNSTDPDSAAITYLFEVDSSLTFDSPDRVASGSVEQGTDTTSWLASGLKDNTYYYARVKATDGNAESPLSALVGFFVNTANDAPTAPVLSNPSDGSGINTFNPVLSLHNSTDLDKDLLTYGFEVYADAAMTNLIISASDIQETPQITSWAVPVALAENSTYFWRARAFDGELYSPWMVLSSFTVNTANDAPTAPSLNAPSQGSSLSTLTPTLSINNATDPDSDSLTYEFEIYAGTTLVRSMTAVPQNASGITSVALSALSDNTTYTWRARAYDGDRYGAWMDMATFSVHLPSANITATIEVEPETLNRKSQGNWITVKIDLPRGYRAADINISSIRLEGVVHAEPWPYHLGCNHEEDGSHDDRDSDHHDGDGNHDDREIMVKFRRSEALNLLPDGNHVPVHVTGRVGAVTFEGVDYIRVIH